LAILFGSVSISESLNNSARSTSAANTVSKSVSSVDGASWATEPTLKFLGISINPPSMISSF